MGGLPPRPGGMRGAWLDSLNSKNSNKNSKKISKSIWTRSDPSGGGGFNRAARSPQGRVSRANGEERTEKSEGMREKREERRRETGDERRDMLILKLLSIDQSVAGAKIPAVLSLHKQVRPPVNLRICSTPWSVFQDGSNKTIL